VAGISSLPFERGLNFPISIAGQADFGGSVELRVALTRERFGAVLMTVLGAVALILTATGGAGLSGAVAFSRLLEACLWGVASTDPFTLAAMAGGVLGIATLACGFRGVKRQASILSTRWLHSRREPTRLPAPPRKPPPAPPPLCQCSVRRLFSLKY